MTLKEFNELEERDQYKEIWNGVFISDRTEEEFVVMMYKVHSFFVEVYYHPGSNFIEGFRSFILPEIMTAQKN